MGSKKDQIILQIYSEEMQKFKLAAEGFSSKQPPKHLRSRIIKYFKPVPKWYLPNEEQDINSEKFDLHAITQRPPHMYHSWGSQNAWLRQITNKNYLYISEFIACKKK